MARTTTMDVTGGGPFVDVDGDTHLNVNDLYTEGALLRLGAPTVVTIDGGVATISTGFVALAAETGEADQLDTLTLAGAGEGDVVLLVADTGDTITVDDANIDLGGATREVGPGGCLALRYDGTSWVEMFFLAGADNA